MVVKQPQQGSNNRRLETKRLGKITKRISAERQLWSKAACFVTVQQSIIWSKTQCPEQTKAILVGHLERYETAPQVQVEPWADSPQKVRFSMFYRCLV